MRPTSVRHQILVTATIVAFLMYLDRICLAYIIGSDSFKENIKLSKEESDAVKQAFFWAYALAQVPAGWLSDRYGARFLITFYIAAWSIFTFATSLAVGFVSLMIARIGCGLAEAGYYPASSSLLTRWSHIEARGMASSMISWGGRLGGVVAPALTVYVIVQAGDWRWAGWSYGVLGIAVAWAYWYVFREHPRLHPRCNEAEIKILSEGRGDFQPVREPPKRFPFVAACRSGNLWLANGVQFFTNIGWAFLVLSFLDYLKEVKDLEDKPAGYVNSIALGLGVLALPLGGWLTDVLSRRLGRRVGRMLPMSVTKFIAAGCYLLALQMNSPWSITIAFGLVTFFVDFGLPAMWTTMQDISGKYQAQLFGWGNMWGNFGAALMPWLFTMVNRRYDINHDLNEGVWICAGALVVAGVLSLFLNAEQPAIPDTPDEKLKDAPPLTKTS